MNNQKEGLKKSLKKFWHWLWNSESIWSYVVFIILAYIIIKLIFFPLLSLTLGTALPIAIVESCSMFHEDNFLANFDEWWQYNEQKYEKFNINKEQFSEFKFKKGFNKGDILIMTKADPETLKIGDIIIFNAEREKPVIHRIVDIKETEKGRIFSTLGDHNNGQLSIEKQITEQQLIAKASLRSLPYLGWVKLIFFEPFRTENKRGLCKANF